MGIALKSRQVKIDLIYACVQDLMFLSRGDRDDGDAFQTHPVSQASARGEAKDSDILLGRDRYPLEPTEWPPGSQASCGVWREDSGLLSRVCNKRKPTSRDDVDVSWV